MFPKISAPTEAAHATLAKYLDAFGRDVCTVLADFDCQYIVLEEAQRYCDASPALRRIKATVDSWPIPPAGLCVVEERVVILRSLSPMTFFHETSHLIDLALGRGVYLSGVDPRFRKQFARATQFVSPYAACAVDEWFAESSRAYWGHVGNDPHSIWPRATRERLAELDPVMFAFMRNIFEVMIPERAALIRAMSGAGSPSRPTSTCAASGLCPGE